MEFDAHIYVLHTIYVHPHIASCSEGTGIASMDVKQQGLEANLSSPPPSARIRGQTLQMDNLRQPLITVVICSN
jgi:hypothetical protein